MRRGGREGGGGTPVKDGIPRGTKRIVIEGRFHFSRSPLT